jgi:hypothetical protein
MIPPLTPPTWPPWFDLSPLPDEKTRDLQLAISNATDLLRAQNPGAAVELKFHADGGWSLMLIPPASERK